MTRNLDPDWQTALRQNPTFGRLSGEHLEHLLRRMQRVPVRAGQIVCRQGERGGDYYVIESGEARVSRWDGKVECELARLTPTMAFGEDALIADSPRNATVTMATAGVLRRLSRDDFQALLQQHVVEEIDYRTSRELVGAGALRIDVRSAQEFAASGLRHALNVPLPDLRERIDQLDPAVTYIVYCDTGARSTAAAFLLALRGIDARVLRGGLLRATH